MAQARHGQSDEKSTSGNRAGRRRSGPGAQRLRTHEQAKAELSDLPAPRVLEHPLVCADEPALIDTSEQLDRLMAQLRACGRFAYDSEFIGEMSYHAKLCVVQVATADRIALIDPLGGLDLRPFWEVLADPSIVKIVHAGVQDLEPVFRHLGRPGRSVLDSQIAAAFIGRGFPCGLGRLVQELVEADLGQGMKFTQWDARPLTPRQLHYAANDVRYLSLLWEKIAAALDQSGNTAWALQECRTLEDPALYRFDPLADRLNVRGVDLMGPGAKALLRSLVAWREAAARHEDVPARTLLKDGVLVELSRRPVTSVERLPQVRGMPVPLARRFGPDIIEAIRTGLDRPHLAADRWPIARFREQRDQIDAIFTALKHRCLARQIDPVIVTSKMEMARFLLTDQPARPADRPANRLAGGWRHELLGPLLDPLVGLEAPPDA